MPSTITIVQCEPCVHLKDRGGFGYVCMHPKAFELIAGVTKAFRQIGMTAHCPTWCPLFRESVAASEKKDLTANRSLK